MAETQATTVAPQKPQGGGGLSTEGKAGGGFGPYKAGPKYAKGDPSKGRDEKKDIPFFIEGPQIAMRDRRAYLVDQAVKNESANDEINAKQVEENQRIAQITFEALDPDKARDETTEAALEEIDRHTPEYVEQARKNRQQMLAAAPLRARGHTPEDAFIAGSRAPEPATTKK